MILPRDFLASATGAAALVLSILGSVFLVIGAPLAALSATRQTGLSSLVWGGAILAAGLLLGARRAAALRRRRRLLEAGTESPGNITEVRLNPWVKINGRRPWLVRYRYDVGGTAYQGSEVLWNLPPQFTQGAPATVVFDASDPGRSALRRG